MTKCSPPSVERGFTLIEFLVVVFAIGILAALAVPALSTAYERAKVTKDLSNLRQTGAATQLDMNDNNGAFPGSATLTWMQQLEQNQKYLSSWRVLECPFDKRATSELGDANTAVSYGINAKVYDANNVAMSAGGITKPVTFIVFAPAQASTPTVSFQGVATSLHPAPQFWLRRALLVEWLRVAHTTTAPKLTRLALTGTLRQSCERNGASVY